MEHSSKVREKIELSIESEGERPLAFIHRLYGNGISSMLWANRNWGEPDQPYDIPTLQNLAVTMARTYGADYSYINKALIAQAVIERRRK